MKFKINFCAALLASLFLSHWAVAQTDWVGPYFGASVGAQFGNSKNTTGDFGYNDDNQEWGYGETGLTGDVHLGYNYRWNSLIIGPELDLGYLKLSGSGVQPDSPGNDTTGKSTSDFFTSLRARIGTEHDRWLIYATGGLIGVNYESRIIDNCDVAPCGGTLVEAHRQSLKWGYTVGAGAERRIAERWAAKLEYLYFDLGTQNFSGTTNLDVSYDWSGKTSGHIIRAGLAFYFGGAEPTPEPTKVQAEVEEPKPEAPHMAELSKVAKVAKTETGMTVILQGDVSFESGKWELNPHSKTVLTHVADALIKTPHQKILIYGYTDSSGKTSWNKLLSERRANSVKNFLANKGISRDKMTAKGFGIERAIASNNTFEGRAKNRRVEISIE